MREVTAAGARAGPADEAVRALYHSHYTALVRTAVLLVGDVPTAEEVVQDSFIAMYRAWWAAAGCQQGAAVPAQLGDEPGPLGAAAPGGGRPACPRTRAGCRQRRGERAGAAGTLVGARGPDRPAHPAAVGDGAALLRRPVRGADRRHLGDRPGLGQVPRRPGPELASGSARLAVHRDGAAPGAVGRHRIWPCLFSGPADHDRQIPADCPG
jgi:hypothetical protein